MAVPDARVSKKPEVFPGKNACAIVEKPKAESAKADLTRPITVVLYNQEEGKLGRCHGNKIWTDDLVGETPHDSIQGCTITCLAADPT